MFNHLNDKMLFGDFIIGGKNITFIIDSICYSI